MLLLLLRNNWKPIAIILLFGAVYGYGFYSGNQHAKNKWPAKEEAIINEQKAICAKNQALTQEVSHDLQTKLTSLDARYALALKRLRTAERNVPTPNTAAGHDAAAGTNGLSGADRDADLLSLAVTADRQTSQLIACQDFIRKVWEMNQ